LKFLRKKENPGSASGTGNGYRSGLLSQEEAKNKSYDTEP
jgi:hypothetical protein